MALQEVDQKTTRTGGVDQAAELARFTGLRFRYGKAMDYQGGAYGQALLSRWPLEEFTVHALPNPANVEPRIAISATVRPPGRPPCASSARISTRRATTPRVGSRRGGSTNSSATIPSRQFSRAILTRGPTPA